jgi:hypothetical protein
MEDISLIETIATVVGILMAGTLIGTAGEMMLDGNNKNLLEEEQKQYDKVPYISDINNSGINHNMIEQHKRNL